MSNFYKNRKDKKSIIIFAIILILILTFILIFIYFLFIKGILFKWQGLIGSIIGAFASAAVVLFQIKKERIQSRPQINIVILGKNDYKENGKKFPFKIEVFSNPAINVLITVNFSWKKINITQNYSVINCLFPISLTNQQEEKYYLLNYGPNLEQKYETALGEFCNNHSSRGETVSKFVLNNEIMLKSISLKFLTSKNEFLEYKFEINDSINNLYKHPYQQVFMNPCIQKANFYTDMKNQNQTN